MAVNDAPLQFKFKWLDENGNEKGFRSSKGRFDDGTLVLDDVEIPAAVILHLETREKYLVVTLFSPDGQPSTLAISAPGKAREIKAAVDIARSAVWAEHHREELRQNGREHAYRDERCPHCGATLVLSDMPRTPQLYCHFCDTLATTDPTVEIPAGERELHICDECGMFSKPRKFTVFYFYFLVFVYGWRSYSTWRCPACMRGVAWKMFFGNLPFVLGVPPAMVQLFRSYGGGVLGGAFKGLDTANIRAKKGDLVGALQIYRSILERVPHSAGIKYNLGRALFLQNDLSRAADTFELALGDCSNYVQAYHMLAQCYEQLGAEEKLAELKRQWGQEKKAEAPAPIENVAERVS